MFILVGQIILLFFVAALFGYGVRLIPDKDARFFVCIGIGVITNVLLNLTMGPFSFLEFLGILIIFIIGFKLGEKTFGKFNKGAE